MTLPAPTYDLVIMLDPQAEESTRTRIVADARAAIEAQGEFLRHDEWGVRALTYPIDHKTSAEYHLLQLHATPQLLETLNRTLRIADEVVRFRIIKLAPGTPDAPEMPAAVAPTTAAATTATPMTPPRREAEPDAEPDAELPTEPDAELAVGEPA
jgi:small subunit ribosomal protein S6